MHASNRAFWQYCQKKYQHYFLVPDIKVLELGSMDINGTVRDYFEVGEFVGVDWRPGKCVDVVSLAHEIEFDHQFDVVISASMLEHDPHWNKSISKMVEYLKEDGILLLSWGAALNPPHEHETADDCQFHSLPAYKVLELLKELGLYTHEFRYEGLQFPELCTKRIKNTIVHSGMGEVCLVAFKDQKYAVGERHIDKMVREDRRPKIENAWPDVVLTQDLDDMVSKLVDTLEKEGDIVWGPEDDVTYVGNSVKWELSEDDTILKSLEKSQTDELISKMMKNVNDHIENEVLRA